MSSEINRCELYFDLQRRDVFDVIIFVTLVDYKLMDTTISE